MAIDVWKCCSLASGEDPLAEREQFVVHKDWKRNLDERSSRDVERLAVSNVQSVPAWRTDEAKVAPITPFRLDNTGSAE